MHNKPVQPLERLQQEQENERLRNLLFHLANYVQVNILPKHQDPALILMLEIIMAEVEKKEGNKS